MRWCFDLPTHNEFPNQSREHFCYCCYDGWVYVISSFFISNTQVKIIQSKRKSHAVELNVEYKGRVLKENKSTLDSNDKITTHVFLHSDGDSCVQR